MKRWIGSLALACVAGAAIAQAPFTIARPADNSRVREKVKVLIPKGSIPPGGYVGIFLNGKFIEATVPPIVGKYYEYTLDTKGRGISDTEPGKPIKLEAVLYVDYKEQPRIVDRSSVDINVGNKANIPVPNGGVKLRYNFRPGNEMIYTLEQRVSVSSITESQNQLGGKAAELPIEAEKLRLLYAVDNQYGNGDGLLRIQPLPTKGKDYAVLTAAGDTGPKKYLDSEMAAIYMRVDPTGRQIFGSVPFYFPMEGTSGQGSLLDLYADFPLPSLPYKAVRPGDSWKSNFQQPKLDLENRGNTDNLVAKQPARGEFVGTEWEMGHPCAKIRNVIEQSEKSTAASELQKRGSNISKGKISITETIWFALDSKKVLKIVQDTMIEGKIDAAQIGFGGGQAGQPPSNGRPGFGGRPGGPPGGLPGVPPGNGSGGRGSKDDRIPDTFRQGNAPLNLGPNKNAPGINRGGGTPPSGFGQPGFGGGNTGAAPAQAEYVRIRLQRIFTLEQ